MGLKDYICGCDFAGPDYTVTWTVTSPEPPLHEKVKQLEQELADAKAKLAAEAEKAKKKTRGEEIAETRVMIIRGIDGAEHYVNVSGENFKPNRSIVCKSPGCEVGDDIRLAIASIVDKAIADAKAEQRESDAKLVEMLACYATFANEYPAAIRRDSAAAAIRKNK